MSEENIRRSGRATKGQHTKSSSPAPPRKTKQAAKSKAQKSEETAQDSNEYDDEDDIIRCICGDDNPKDKRTFIGCDACSVWQHNVCMGISDEDDEQPEHYFCEQDAPEEHAETLMALERGEKIWETRNKIYQNEKKAGSRRKGPGGKPRAWLKKDVAYESQQGEGEEEEAKEETPEKSTRSKRKREEEEEEPEPEHQEIKAEPDEKPTRSSRQDKRRKAVDGTAAATQPEPDLVPIDQLPADRQKIAAALNKILLEDFNNRAKARALDIPEGQTVQSYAEQHALRIENALKTSHESTPATYASQFRALNANLKKNRELIARLLDGGLTAEELSTMSSADMASEELQKQRAVMKEQLDRQAVAIEVAEGPKYRRTHKGDELIEDENAAFKEGGSTSQPVRERTSVQEEAEAGSPTAGAGSPPPLKVESDRSQSMSRPGPGMEQRRQSSQQFDMNSIWAKTAQSPTSSTTPGGVGGARPMQMPPKRRSSVKQQPSQDGGVAGTKEDADVDRMLQDDEEDETYSPAEYADPDGIVWRGKLIQSADGVSPTVNARFVAGRDLTSTVPWKELLPSHLSIDGRLQIAKAEEYLCSLQWSQSSDVSILSLTPYDDAEGFETVWKYFRTRERYAVVNKDKPAMVKDLYIIPVDAGQEVPSHVGMLEYNRLGGSVDHKCLLVSMVVARGVSAAQVAEQMDGAADAKSPSGAMPAIANGQQHVLPQHMRSAAAGPAGSPLNASGATFSPPGQPQFGDAYPVGLPPNPYSDQQPPAAAFTNPLVSEILGPLQFAPSAKSVVDADPTIGAEKLTHLKSILENYPVTRTDLAALGAHLRSNG